MLQQVVLLTGHTSPETAYIIPDYPYGFRLRCTKRVWIETATRGAAKGQQRLMEQTTNPKKPDQPWNKPKASTYNLIKAIYLDDEGHVQSWGAGPNWVSPEHDARTRLTGVYEQLEQLERHAYDWLVTVSRETTNPETWRQWETAVAELAEHIREHGQAPGLRDDRWWEGPNGPRYLPDPEVAIAAAEARAQTP